MAATVNENHSSPVGPVVLITGASDGIGRALSRIYRARGARVIGVGRRPAAMVSPDLRSDYCRVDLAQPFAAALIAEFLRQHGVGRLDLLVHCAGIGSYGAVDAQTPEEIDALLNVNLRAPIMLTYALLPRLMAGRGRVVFVGSVVAALPAPDYAVYGATKAALEGFARGLREELRGMLVCRWCIQALRAPVCMQRREFRSTALAGVVFHHQRGRRNTSCASSSEIRRWQPSAQSTDCCVSPDATLVVWSTQLLLGVRFNRRIRQSTQNLPIRLSTTASSPAAPTASGGPSSNGTRAPGGW